MNEDLPKVSVVTITYGHEKYIEDTLNGVIMQRYDGPIEFIIANDHSPDETDAVVKRYLATHVIPQNIEIRYTNHSENKGMMPNFIWALQEASGTYIAFCEGDDYWTDPLKLQKQVDFLENNQDYQLCYTEFSLLEDRTGTLFRDCFKNRIKPSFRIPRDHIDFLINMLYIAPCSWLFKRSFIEKIGLSTDCEDGTYKIAIEGLLFTKFAFLADNTTVHRALDESASRTESIIKRYIREEKLFGVQEEYINSHALGEDLQATITQSFYRKVAYILVNCQDQEERERIYDLFGSKYDCNNFNKILLAQLISSNQEIKNSRTYQLISFLGICRSKFLGFFRIQ